MQGAETVEAGIEFALLRQGFAQSGSERGTFAAFDQGQQVAVEAETVAGEEAAADVGDDDVAASAGQGVIQRGQGVPRGHGVYALAGEELRWSALMPRPLLVSPQ